MLTRALPGIRCRQIVHTDADAVVDLLTRGFPVRGRSYWQQAFTTLAAHPTPSGLPKFGYLLETDGAVIGVILLIFSVMPSKIPGGASPTIRCNLSSWYVEPAFRSHAALLISLAIRHKDVTYLNISPATHTRPIVEAQGFSLYSTGQFVTIPALAPRSPDAEVKIFDQDVSLDVQFEPAERELLNVHRSYGCCALWCVSGARAYPFVFMPRTVRGVIPCAHLVYCRDIAEFVRFARPLGRALIRRKRPFVIVDANGPIPGLVGKFFDGRAPKYFKGPQQPGSGDLAYTEAVLFGL